MTVRVLTQEEAREAADRIHRQLYTRKVEADLRALLGSHEALRAALNEALTETERPPESVFEEFRELHGLEAQPDERVASKLLEPGGAGGASGTPAREEESPVFESPCGCYVRVGDERETIDAVAFLCNQGHRQGDVWHPAREEGREQ